MQSVQGVKDFAYAARIIFISTRDSATLESRLKESGRFADVEIPDLLKAAEKEKEEATTSENLYDAVIGDDDLEAAYTALEAFIYGGGDKLETTNGVHADSTNGESGADVAMADPGPLPAAGEEEKIKADEPQTETNGV
jgi:THO complex subunit 1